MNNIDSSNLLWKRPQAYANIRGSIKYAKIAGLVKFYQLNEGVVVAVEVTGLPVQMDMHNRPVFGFHIHEGKQCRGNVEDPFAQVGQHYNPGQQEHPYHAGDLLPLFGNEGYAMQMFLTDRFTVKEIIGKTIIIHSMRDDFTTQPSGNSGEKIACGEIRSMEY